MSITFFSTTLAVSTGIYNPVLPSGTGTGPGEPIFGRIISAVIGIFLFLGVVMALFHLILGAYKWLTSSGDKTKLETAREQIVQALVGLLLLASIWAVITLVTTFLGIQFPIFKLPTIETT